MTPPLAQQVAELRTALETARKQLEHSVPGDCYSTGPRTGSVIQDHLVCPGCSAIADIDKALANTAPPPAAEAAREDDGIAELIAAAQDVCQANSERWRNEAISKLREIGRRVHPRYATPATRRDDSAGGVG